MLSLILFARHMRKRQSAWYRDFEHTPVLHVERDGEALSIETPGGNVWADHVAVASGVWSGMFLNSSG